LPLKIVALAHNEEDQDATVLVNNLIMPLARSLTANWNDGNRKEAGVVLAHIVGSGPEAAQTVHAIARMLKKVRRSRIPWWLGIVKSL
jgi:cohesin complex subunit SA-1/2